jgi:hypothetical protein
MGHTGIGRREAGRRRWWPIVIGLVVGSLVATAALRAGGAVASAGPIVVTTAPGSDMVALVGSSDPVERLLARLAVFVAPTVLTAHDDPVGTRWGAEVTDATDPGTAAFEARRAVARLDYAVTVVRASAPVPFLAVDRVPPELAAPTEADVARLDDALRTGSTGLTGDLRVASATLRGTPASLYVVVETPRSSVSADELAPLVPLLSRSYTWIVQAVVPATGEGAATVVRTVWNDASGGGTDGAAPVIPAAERDAICRADEAVPDMIGAYNAMGAPPVTCNQNATRVAFGGFGGTTVDVMRAWGAWYDEDVWRRDLFDAFEAQLAAEAAVAGLPRPTLAVEVPIPALEQAAGPPRRIRYLEHPWRALDAARLARRVAGRLASLHVKATVYPIGAVVQVKLTAASNAPKVWSRAIRTIRSLATSTGITNPVIASVVNHNAPTHCWWRYTTERTVVDRSGWALYGSAKRVAG